MSAAGKLGGMLPVRGSRSPTGLPAGQRRSAWLAALFLFSFVAAVTVLKSAANGLLLAQHDARVLPWLYVATPVAVGLALLLLVRPGGKALPALGSVLAATLLVGLFLVHPLAPAAVSLVLYLSAEAAATSISVCLWEQLGTLFDSRTAKRIFGLLGAAGMAGAMAGGAFVYGCSELLGTLTLLPFAAGALLVASACGLLLRRRLAPADTAAELPLPGSRGDGAAGGASHQSLLRRWGRGVELIAADRYPLLIGLLVVLLSVLTVMVDFLFRSRAQALLQDDQLTAVFGSVNFVVGLVSIVFQLFFTGWLLTRIDVRGYLLAVLGVIGLAAGSGLVGLGFGAIYALKVSESSSSLSLSQPAIQLLYHPLPPGDRVILRSLIDGVLKKVGIALGGGLLLASLPLGELLVSEQGVLLLLALSAGTVLWLHREHRLLLERRVRLAGQGAAGPDLADADARGTLSVALRSHDPARVLAALGLARQDPSFDLAPLLPELLMHPSPRVRRAAVGLSSGQHDSPLLRLMSVMAAQRPSLEADEVRSLARLHPEQAPEILQGMLSSPDLQDRSVAIEALYPLEDELGGPAHQMLQRLALWSRAAPAVERCNLVELLGRLADRALVPLLAPYLRDPDPAVRRAAIESAGKLRQPTLVPALLELLQDRGVRQAVVQALARCGDATVDLCEIWLNDRNRALEVRLQIPGLLRRIGSPRAGRALLFSNIEDDPFLRDRIAEALATIHRENPEIPFERSWSMQAMQRRLNSFDYYLPLYVDLLALFAPRHLLMRLLGDRLLQNVLVLLRVLSLLHPAETFHAIRIRWLFGDRQQRADALDLLERVLEPEVRRVVVQMLERYDRLRDEGLVSPALGIRSGAIQDVSGHAVKQWVSGGRLLRAPAAGSPPSPALAALAEQSCTAVGRASAPLGAEGSRPGAGHPGGGSDEQRAVARLSELTRSRDLLLRAIAHRAVAELKPESTVDLGPVAPLLESEMSDSHLDRVLFLQSVDLFENQRVDDLVAVAQIAEERRFAGGEVIYRENDPSDVLYILMEGEVALTLQGKALLSVRPGESFGQLSMLDHKPRPATATAVSEVRVLSLGRIELFDLIADRGELLQGVVEVLVKRIRDLLEEVVEARRAGQQQAEPATHAAGDRAASEQTSDVAHGEVPPPPPAPEEVGCGAGQQGRVEH